MSWQKSSDILSRSGKVALCRKKSLEKVDGLLRKSLEKVLDLWYTMCEVRKRFGGKRHAEAKNRKTIS